MTFLFYRPHSQDIFYYIILKKNLCIVPLFIHAILYDRLSISTCFCFVIYHYII
jgi:hypothetical protein